VRLKTCPDDTAGASTKTVTGALVTVPLILAVMVYAPAVRLFTVNGKYPLFAPLPVKVPTDCPFTRKVTVMASGSGALPSNGSA